ncbi:MAG: ATP phosphoribosyltransferase regulatory subunit [Betaproteobacteria bacterium]|nr:ATP phosphoribosyltransferase regulatory subunit [Betaproteobacteria bacterium]
MRTWLLPEYIEDVLPADARRLEDMRRLLVDRFQRHGYQLVMPPLLEYVDSLLSATGEDMELATFKLVDQLSGRMMGIRADHTPQTARIDAHLLNRAGVTRLCYAGPVLHTLPSGLMRSREPFQVGAELYGHADLQADLEVLRLLIEGLTGLGLTGVHLDLSHAGIFHALIEDERHAADDTAALFAAIKAKDLPALANLAPRWRHSAALRALPELYGGPEILDVARARLPDSVVISAALSALKDTLKALDGSGVSLSFDLAELGGFNYERGITFAAYVEGSADAIARGGRYDEVGKAFGRARPATGFTLDLKPLLEIVPRREYSQGIFAPTLDDATLRAEVRRLRDAGEIVVEALPGESVASASCDRTLQQTSAGWRVAPAGPN